MKNIENCLNFLLIVGCGFLQGNIQIDHSVSVSNRPLCWVTIPRIEKVVDQQAHSIYAYIDDYGKLNGKLSIYNMLTGTFVDVILCFNLSKEL